MESHNQDEHEVTLVQSRRNWRILATVYFVLQTLLFIVVFVQNPTVVLFGLIVIFVGIIAMVWKGDIERMLNSSK